MRNSNGKRGRPTPPGSGSDEFNKSNGRCVGGGWSSYGDRLASGKKTYNLAQQIAGRNKIKSEKIQKFDFLSTINKILKKDSSTSGDINPTNKTNACFTKALRDKSNPRGYTVDISDVNIKSLDILPIKIPVDPSGVSRSSLIASEQKKVNKRTEMFKKDNTKSVMHGTKFRQEAKIKASKVAFACSTFNSSFQINACGPESLFAFFEGLAGLEKDIGKYISNMNDLSIANLNFSDKWNSTLRDSGIATLCMIVRAIRGNTECLLFTGN